MDTNENSPEEHSKDLSSTALIIAAWGDDIDALRRMLDAGAEIDGVEGSRGQGWTAAMHAASSGHERSLRLLIEHGANLDRTERDGGKTALEIAEDHGHAASAEMIRACVLARDERVGLDASIPSPSHHFRRITKSL